MSRTCARRHTARHCWRSIFFPLDAARAGGRAWQVEQQPQHEAHSHDVQQSSRIPYFCATTVRWKRWAARSAGCTRDLGRRGGAHGRSGGCRSV